MLLMNLADVVRRSGLPVVEIPGWRNRGHGHFESIETLTCHHTAGPPDSRTASDYPSLGTVRDGRPGLDGPLAQLGLGFSGTVYVIAAGVCWHTGATFHTWQNNWHSIGIEAEHPGGDHPWPPDQYDAYVTLARTLHQGYDVPVDRVLGHKEVATPAGRKPDPNFNMDNFRAQVGAVRPSPPTGEDDDDMTPQQAAQLTAVYNQTRANAGLMVSNTNILTALVNRELEDDADKDAALAQLQRDVDAVQAELAKEPG